jgi:hypothetical protein
MQMIEEALPMTFRTAPLLERFSFELKKYHRWLGIWFYYSPNFPRVLRVISLSTSVIAMLFIQAVTYNIAEVDDGSCESYVDSTSCLSEPSALDQSTNKCYWDSDNNKCHYIEPTNDLLRVVFVAIVSAIWSAPVAICANWLIIRVLAAETASSRKVHSISSFKTDSIVVDSSQANSISTNSHASSDVTVTSLFSQTVAEEVHNLNRAVMQYKKTLDENEQREYAGIILLYIL